MMDTALQTHKQSSFGWLLSLQAFWRAVRTPCPARKYPRLIAPR